MPEEMSFTEAQEMMEQGVEGGLIRVALDS